MPFQGPIPPFVQRKWLRWVAESWTRINRDELGGGLREPQFAVDRAQARLGRWEPVSRTIGISIEHILQSTSWLEVELTLRHEMAHQVVHELFVRPGASPHGELFHKACRMLGIEHGPRAPHSMSPRTLRVLDRVRKLVRLGSSPNPHEAQAALAAASRLLLKHNLDLSDAGEGPERLHGWRWIGPATGRVRLERKLLSGLLVDFFFVRCIWIRTWDNKGQSASVLEAVGAEHNLQLASYVHDYLMRTVDDLWAAYRAAHPGGGVARRNEYRNGVLMGFREHLEAEKTVQQTEGLIWLGDPALDELYDARHPKRRSMSRSYYRTGEAHEAGKEDGRNIRIRPAVGGEDTPTERGRRLQS